MSEPIEPQTEVGIGDSDGFAGRVAAVSLTLSAAAEELQRAAERMRTAEDEIAKADLRARAAEEQLAEGERRSAELMDVLQRARQEQNEAETRANGAEQALHVAMERTRSLEERIRDLEASLEEALSRPPVTVVLDQQRNALQQAVASEVRRPLTSILGLTLALKHHDPNSSEGKDMVRQLSANCRKLDRLVTTFLELDRLIDGTMTPNRRRTDMEALVRRVVEETPDLANREVTVHAAHVVTAVDPALTEQMVETLLANAGRRAAPGNPVWVSVLEEPGGVVVAVDDSGPEIPSGLRQALFEALGDTGPVANQRARGATGLSLLSRLAEIHGGRAWVEERAGGGASFRVFLPDVPQETVGAAPEEPSAAASLPQRSAEGEAITI
jgi:K+-sensing histidine kinase KdpD